MIAEIAQAIMNHFNQSTTLKDVLTGGLHFQLAPQNMTSPYAVFYIMGITHEEIMGAKTNNITDVSIQFNLFEESEDGGSEMASIADILDAAYHWAEISVSGYNRIKSVSYTHLTLPTTPYV